ncbi:LLM class flavin-dependent oxidoreductase [Pseudochelatococcus sp. B33]
MTGAGIRFGVWAPVHGPRAALNDPQEPFNASWEHNKAVVLEAEDLGFDSVLIAQHTVNPHLPDHDQLETWTAAAALAALTRRIEIIAAIKPYIFHPVFLAKMALQIENISAGRFAFNLVNAWNSQEFEQAGIAFGEHDERYAYGREWISIVSRLVAGQTVSHDGPHFTIADYKLTPKDLYRPRPLIYIGGESEPARALAAEQADVWFINGQPLANVAALISDLRRRPRNGTPLRFGLSAFVIARETEAEAQDAHERLIALASQGNVHALQGRHADPKAVMFKTMAHSPRIGTNGGTAAGLVGSYDRVSERILAFHAAGIELFMLQFQPLRAELRRFADNIIPRVRVAEGNAVVSRRS